MNFIIIGNGVTGITAAVTIRKLSATHQITVISSESEHFYSRTALMYLYMGHMQYPHIKPYEDWFWQENNINLIKAQVTKVDFTVKQIALDDKNTLTYDKLLIATGSLPNKINVPGETLLGVQGFYNLSDLENLEINSANINQAVIVGGGLIGVELAEMFYSRCIPVTFLVREKNYWGQVLPPEEATLIENHIREHGIDLRLQTQLQEITSDAKGRVNGIITTSGEQISCQLVGMAIGVSPNIAFLRHTDLQVNRGVVVNQYLEANIPHVYAAGDCAELQTKDSDKTLVEQLWYTGRMQGETVAYTMCGQRTPYQRDIWFNSARFFDIEYQTYGQVPAVLPTGDETLYWQHKDGKKSLRINYESATGQVLGFNLFGIRYRHEVCARWIQEHRSIAYVLQHLKEANFDPEFFRRYEKEITTYFSRNLSVKPQGN
ncbi:MAG: FAD-dependent oxidoreductase [Cytophagales bacterium CG18_big_fil_WC_8_21_14_2_50_42_9]|nr:MAG: FAD-dependent oxidoreductase [Cytophagales bacterium CG18_big_fil_WC_8_21_14_2_50_42_9]